MTSSELDRLIIAWLDNYYPEVRDTYTSTSLMFGSTPELDLAIGVFLDVMSRNFGGLYVYQVSYEEACRALRIERTEIPIIFYDVETLEELWEN